MRNIHAAFLRIEQAAARGIKITDTRAPLDPELRMVAEHELGEIIRTAAQQLSDAPTTFGPMFPAGDEA